MNRTLLFLSAAIIFIVSCKKENYISSPDAVLYLSTDTLRFDTVFTSAGSVTASFKIFNLNEAKLKISSIELAGGSSSQFRMNADGSPGPEVRDLEINANDSLYVFVTVNVNPTSATTPFIISDSIKVNYNGQSQWMQLTAYGQNARYLRSARISTNTTWDKTLPYVILGGVQIDNGVTLSIESGTRIFLHADAPFIVDGTLKVAGTKNDSVVFQGDRLDKDYRDLPASWPGIYFRETSRNNTMKYAVIKNAFQGVVALGPSPSFPKLDLTECVINNIFDAGIFGIASSIRAVNCLVSNSGLNILLTNGGEYELTHCTVASYSNVFIQHRKPVLAISNWDSSSQINSYNLIARIRNNIFWGDFGNVDDEVFISRRGIAPFSVVLENNLYKALNPITNATLINNIVNQQPLFDSIADFSRYYDFRINKGLSPAINKGKNLGVATDLDGRARDSQPDMGSYEKQ